jgi:hypothetical protein
MFRKIAFFYVYFMAVVLGFGYISDTDVKGMNGESIKARVQKSYGKLPLYFIQNDGQVDERVRFYEKGSGHGVFFTEKGIYFSLVGGRQLADGNLRSEDRSKERGEKQENSVIGEHGSNVDGWHGQTVLSSEIQNPKSEIVRLLPLFTNKNLEIVAEDVQDGKVNYFTGNDPEKWKINIPTYKTVVYRNIYKDVDMRFYGNNQQLEYDIIVEPGANLSRIQFAYQGIEGLRITEDGDLELRLKEGKLVQKKPYVYQEIAGERIEIDGKFKILDAKARYRKQETGSRGVLVHERWTETEKTEVRCKMQDLELLTRNPKPETRNLSLVTRQPSHIAYGFQVASYNKKYPLIIDPVLVYSTYLGGSSSDIGNDIAVDGSGNTYITGYTSSSDFPTASALYGSTEGSWDVFVTKLNASGSSLVYSTFLGGSLSDKGNGIAVDGSGNAYVTGVTESSDFPTASAKYGSNAGGSDAFVTKLNASGNGLTYSTYLGGNNDDVGYDVAVDGTGNAYVTGNTYSSNFPTAFAIYKSNAGGGDVFVMKLNTSGSSLAYSTYLGGSNDDFGNDIAVDESGNAHITGYTLSSNFPTTSAIYGSSAGSWDVFVTKLNASGISLVYSTYLGGSLSDKGYGITVDGTGNAYVTGMTGSSNFPTASAIYENNAGGNDAFVTMLNALGSSLVYSTYLGGGADDVGYDIVVDGIGNAYVTGNTDSSNFPTASAIRGSNVGGGDVFVTKLNTSGSGLTYSTYLGGSKDDFGNGIAVDGSGDAYVTGYTLSSNFLTASAIYGNNAGGSDVFITKIGVITTPTPSPVPSTSPTANITPTVSPAPTTTPSGKGSVLGNVVDSRNKPIESVKLKLKGKLTKTSKTTSSDEEGYFEFKDLDKDNYLITASKKGYKTSKKKIRLGEGKEKVIKIKMKKKE